MMKKGLVAFDLIKNGKVVDHIQLSVTGDHNVSNALASIATAELLQIPMETIKKGILFLSVEQTVVSNTREHLTV